MYNNCTVVKGSSVSEEKQEKYGICCYITWIDNQICYGSVSVATANFYYLHQGRYVCLSTGHLKKLFTDLEETRWLDVIQGSTHYILVPVDLIVAL